ncbi:MAG TPA: hypothetical protein VIL34_22775 [Actinopolymorphaceae bacterium]|jgi:hypothetical protein
MEWGLLEWGALFFVAMRDQSRSDLERISRALALPGAYSLRLFQAQIRHSVASAFRWSGRGMLGLASRLDLKA